MPPAIASPVWGGLLGGIYAFWAGVSLASVGAWPGFSYTWALLMACGVAGLSASVFALFWRWKAWLLPPTLCWLLLLNGLLLTVLMWGEPVLVVAPEHAH